MGGPAEPLGPFSTFSRSARPERKSSISGPFYHRRVWRESSGLLVLQRRERNRDSNLVHLKLKLSTTQIYSRPKIAERLMLGLKSGHYAISLGNSATPDMSSGSPCVPANLLSACVLGIFSVFWPCIWIKPCVSK